MPVGGNVGEAHCDVPDGGGFDVAGDVPVGDVLAGGCDGVGLEGGFGGVATGVTKAAVKGARAAMALGVKLLHDASGRNAHALVTEMVVSEMSCRRRARGLTLAHLSSCVNE